MMKQAEKRGIIKDSGPLVSVVMPNYNTPEEYLRCAIESVLNQTYANIELIIVDDASTGGDVDIIRSYSDNRIVLLRNEVNHHVAFTLNRGLEIARGDYIARMDSDDICLPSRIKEQVAFMQRHRSIDVLCAQARMFGARSGVFCPRLTNAERMQTEMFFNCPVVHPTVMFRGDFLRRHALRYQDSMDYRAAEDYEMWTRCAKLGRLCEYPHVLLNYRIHSGQVSVAAGSGQQAGTRRVRALQLALLGITPTEREAAVHDYFCNGSAAAEIPPEETENWARCLLDANEKYRVWPRRMFAQAVIRRFFVVMAKLLRSGQATPKQLMKLSLMRRALSPARYFDYFRHFLFSKRLNRGI